MPAARSERAALGAAVFLLSGAALAYQILLMRLLAITQWQSLAFLIISLALLGHGASGTLLSLAPDRLRPHFHRAFVLAITAFALAAPLSFAAAQRVPFNGLELMWNPSQLLPLAALCLILMLPFLCAATGFGLAFLLAPQHIAAIYAADLAGAGVGALGAVALLEIARPEQALYVIASAGVLAVLIATRARAAGWAAAGICAAVLLALPPSALSPQISSYKGLPKALLIPGAERVAQHSNAQAWSALVRSDAAPPRQATGLSLRSQAQLPAQQSLFLDGDFAGTLVLTSGPDDYLDELLPALPYRLLDRPRTLILGAAGDADVLLARHYGAREIHVVEPNPDVIELVRRSPAAQASALVWHVADARAFLRRSSQSFDLIVFPVTDSQAAGATGAHAATPRYAYTVEALRDAHARLAPGGYLAVTRWERRLPRESLKLFATAVEALRRNGVQEPRAHLALVRNWDANVLLVKRGPLRGTDLQRLREFCQTRGFEPVYAPDQHGAGEASQALLSPRAADYRRAYKFNIEPATDSRPFFLHFFKWSTLPELLRLRAHGGAILFDSGYLVLAGGLLVALPMAVVLILLPLAALPARTTFPARWRVAGYFVLLGLAFMFVEVASLQRMTLLIGAPLTATTVVLCGFLVFAGLGSAWAQRREPAHLVPRAVAGIALFGVLQLGLLPICLALSADASTPVKSLLALLSLAPLAFCMGMPFPLGLARLARDAPPLLPWAWAINGFASVIATLLAALLALHLGLSAVLLAALLLYGAAAVIWR